MNRMASYQFRNQPNQAYNPFSKSEIRHSRSKAQMCLEKILLIISSFPPDSTSSKQPTSTAQLQESDDSMTNENRALLCVNKGFDMDLKNSLDPPSEIRESKSAAGDERLVSGCSAVAEGWVSDFPAVSSGVLRIDKILEGECAEMTAEKKYGSDSSAIDANEEEEEEPAIVAEKAIGVSSQVQTLESDDDGDSEKTNGEEQSNIEQEQAKNEEINGDGFLGLLIEAAELIFGEFRDDESEVHNHKSTGTETAVKKINAKRPEPNHFPAYGDFEDISPVVRSKRGRSQVLPYKYRDSVLEPLTPLSRHRSNMVPTKRRSR
ncbi:unnamed protein product [Ilex paraguariensis]|uniref:Uncharacterized protein n=1 Tax=Ilex paraguariensis TaxID=185542 RepID=A0ABC8S9G0_9AQUA